MFVFYERPFLHVYFAKNVADRFVPFYSWFCFQRLCRLLWGCHQGVGSLVWSLWPNELSIIWKFICPHWKGHFWGEYLLSCLKVEGVWKLCCHCYFAAWLHWLAVIYFILCRMILPSVLWRCWLGGRKGIRPVKNGVVRCWRGYLSGARCRLAYGPADATAAHCLLLQ